MNIQKGAYLRKEAPADVQAAEAILTNLNEELGTITGLLEKNKKDTDTQFKDLLAHYQGVQADSEDIRKTVLQHTSEYAQLVKDQQALTATVDHIKREMDAPLLRGGSDLKESDTLAAIELQRRAFMHKGGNNDDFVPDMDNLVDPVHYRSAARKIVKHVGIESKRKVVSMLTPDERKAFEASSLDAALFSPEMLGIDTTCYIECADIVDLYNSVTVSKSTFMYPQVLDYGAIGQYDCDAKCDAEYGPEGNITYKNGRVNDFRGVFCLHRKTLAEANYDLLSFMYQAASRSYRLNRNKAMMIGDGVNEPLGWLTADCFTKLKTSTTAFTHIDFRLFFSSAPMEYGPVTAVMHQNMFAYLAAMTDNNGRFFVGDGTLTYSPSDARENIRISNCLPDPTQNLTLGSNGVPFVTGDFLVAAGAWKSAYYIVNKRPLWIEQWEGQSSAWCVKYQFGAEDGGFVGCCLAARIITVGP